MTDPSATLTNKERIIRFLRCTYPAMRTRDIARALGISVPEVRAIEKQLRAKRKQQERQP